MRIIGDCNFCGEHKEVHEILRVKNGEQRVILICNDCVEWMREAVSECEKELDR